MAQIKTTKTTLMEGSHNMTKPLAIDISNELKQQAESVLSKTGQSLESYVRTSIEALVREHELARERKNQQYLKKLDDALDDVRKNGGYEYLGKDKDGRGVFSKTRKKIDI